MNSYLAANIISDLFMLCAFVSVGFVQTIWLARRTKVPAVDPKVVAINKLRDAIEARELWSKARGRSTVEEWQRIADAIGEACETATQNVIALFPEVTSNCPACLGLKRVAAPLAAVTGTTLPCPVCTVKR